MKFGTIRDYLKRSNQKKKRTLKRGPSKERTKHLDACEICHIGMGKSVQNDEVFKHESKVYKYKGKRICKYCKQELGGV